MPTMARPAALGLWMTRSLPVAFQ
uniref:Uncharacterized protein n=1 Tax=Arundo donax TaxID=35708 RepID=A0A0A9FDJ0_ARUDO